MSDLRISAKSGTSYSGDTKYSLKQFTYPSNLFSNKEEYGSTWVMFNINVLEQSKYFSKDTTTEISPAEKKRWTEADARNQSYREAQAAAVGSTLAATALGTALAKTNIDNPIAGFGAAAAATIAIPLQAAKTSNRSTKRLTSAIQLPMPNSLITPYNVGWGDDSTRIFDLLLRAPGLALDAVKGSSAPNAVSDVASSVALAANNAFGNSGLSAAAGLASNPKKEMFFDGVDFRTFTLDYRLYPKDEQESRYIKNIIDMFKFHMYPEYKSTSRFTYIYPSEFDITFFKGDGIENPWVTRIATSVLTNMSVNYTPTGVWAVHADGSPVMVQLSLTFKELSIITKENLRNPANEEINPSPSY